MTSKPTLLLVAGDGNVLSEMAAALRDDFDVLTAMDRASAEAVFRSSRPALTLVDIDTPPGRPQTSESLGLINDMITLDRLAKVIVLSEKGESATGVGSTIQPGSCEVMRKPARMEELRLLVQRRLAGRELERADLQHKPEPFTLEGMFGASHAMQEVFRSIRKVAVTDASVLLYGESGSGKSAAAQAIHRLSARKDGPFVRINCGAMRYDVLESEVIGHEPAGGTVGATSMHGRFQEAISGTLFISEIDELPIPLQGRLVDLLCEHQVGLADYRESAKTDLRVIASSCTDLMKAVGERKFRPDLYYLLAVVVIRVPPLRSREKDVLMLAEMFLDRFAKRYGKTNLAFGEDAIKALEDHAWPGNVRELESRVRRGVIMAEGGVVRASDLELPAVETPCLPHTLKDARRALEREMILQMLEKHGGNISAAASDLRVSRATFYNIMARLGIQRKRVLKSTSSGQILNHDE
ncbi:MAG: sigma-54-dependent Fis family transcriptional regulator [Verrucomicrobia bacterium]|nr:sigma-54-dependent Fis family transcriptional regulator [Verrucomicrobiota bacterium]